ncbi:MAG: hypothetical protein HOQ05_13795 [Corynebacteriales bacterium]|nr:hypothetical protein [Mycobacteriales bacterium]
MPASVLALAVIIGGMYEEGWLTSPPAGSAARGYLVTASVVVSGLVIAMALLGWIVIQFGWFGMRLRFPHSRRYAREYPAVRDLLEEGWHYGTQRDVYP